MTFRTCDSYFSFWGITISVCIFNSLFGIYISSKPNRFRFAAKSNMYYLAFLYSSWVVSPSRHSAHLSHIACFPDIVQPFSTYLQRTPKSILQPNQNVRYQSASSLWDSSKETPGCELHCNTSPHIWQTAALTFCLVALTYKPLFSHYWYMCSISKTPG